MSEVKHNTTSGRCPVCYTNHMPGAPCHQWPVTIPAFPRPGTGLSLTTGEAAARRQALGEAARVARAAVMGDETDAVCLNIADDIRALMDRAPDVDPRDAEIARLRAEVEAMRGAFCVSCRRAGRADNAVAYPCTCDDPPGGMTGLEYRGG